MVKKIPLDQLIVRESMRLPFRGGEIWGIELDSLSIHEEIVREKFLRDAAVAARPSTPSAVALHLRDTAVSEQLANLMAEKLRHGGPNVRRLALIGCDRAAHGYLKAALGKQDNLFLYKFFDDYEKAKEWLIP